MRQTDIGPLFRRTGVIGLDWIGLFVGVGGNLQAQGRSDSAHRQFVSVCFESTETAGRAGLSWSSGRHPGCCVKIDTLRGLLWEGGRMLKTRRDASPRSWWDVGCGMWDVGEDAGCVWLMLAPIGGRLGRPFAGLLQAICAEMRWLGNWQVETLSALPCGAGQGFQSGRVPGSAIRQQLPGQVGAGMNPSSVPRDGVFVCSCTLIPSSLVSYFLSSLR